MTDGQSEVHSEVGMAPSDFHRQKVCTASMWCPCTDEWVVKAVFLCRKDAHKHCEESMRLAVREGRPLEYWRVERYNLHPCAGMVVWGCCSVQQPDDLGAPDCV